ncbi:hypothetical protein BO99DRAFT_417245 [Aspergillus violaceofuscus CBS 115571]|uniref:Phorbol-ester/DAG-type domain-containing protein n=1 Tax=Aspergillus violaceofuscus (strain CBS 115571) TaxID=1450538 RepID=A0A2V5GX82_ASPV1|nr:hypothetical protein BO99DRAFT_417245 [Aspergillus violaceofuscus CBS 115571]
MASPYSLQLLRQRVYEPVRALLSLQRSQSREWCGLCETELLGRARVQVYKCTHCERCYHQDCIEQLRSQEASRGIPLPFGCPGCGTPCLPSEQRLIRHFQAAHPDRERPTVGTSHHHNSSSSYRQRDDPQSAARDSHSPRNSGSTYQSAEDDIN